MTVEVAIYGVSSTSWYQSPNIWLCRSNDDDEALINNPDITQVIFYSAIGSVCKRIYYCLMCQIAQVSYQPAYLGYETDPATGTETFIFATPASFHLEVTVESIFAAAFQLCEDTMDTGASVIVSGTFTSKNPYGYITGQTYGMYPFEVVCRRRGS
jgi:hypothetical protein